MAMDVGIWLGKSVVSERSRRNVNDLFLVVNPSKDELAIKEKILSKIQQSEEKKRKKPKSKTIPLSKMEVGGLYEDANGSKFIFLGHCEYKRYQKCYSLNPIEAQSGYGFIWYYADELTNDGINALITNRLQHEHPLILLKGNKKIIKKIGQVNLCREYELEYSKHIFSSTVYKSTLKLLDLCE